MCEETPTLAKNNICSYGGGSKGGWRRLLNGVCLLANFSSKCDKQIKDYEIVRGQGTRGRFKKCIQKFSGKIYESKMPERPSCRWNGYIKINLS
jgi:hypothetical protein